MLNFRVAEYAAVSTGDAVYILGGYGAAAWAPIARFKDLIWTKTGELIQGRSVHGAITNEMGLTMIIGGLSNDNDPYVQILNDFEQEILRCII